MPILEIKDLKKKYGGNVALDGVSFSLEKGEILGFLGTNGAGKTTTMNIITDYIDADAGEVVIEKGVKIGYLPEQPPLYVDMTVREYLNFVFELKEAKGNIDEVVNSIADKVKITDVLGRLIKNLSKGYRQRVGIAQSLIGDPEIVILDEPTVGLDPIQIIEIRDLIKELAEEHTVILSSHIMQEIESVATKVIIINKGEIVANGELSEICKKGENLEAAFLRLIMTDVKVTKNVAEEEVKNESDI